MATRNANSRGFSLIELLVASALGLMVLVSVGGVYISGQKLALKNTSQLYLSQSISEVLSFLQRDIRRAGYNAANGYPLKLVESSQALFIQGNRLSYVYRTNQPGEADLFKLVSLKGDLADKKLKLCSKTLRSESALSLQECRRYYSIFDDQHLELSDFSISEALVGSEARIITLAITAQLKNSPLTETRSITLTARNFP